MLFMRMAFLSWENYTKKFVNPETKEIDMEAVNADESDEEDYEYVVDQVQEESKDGLNELRKPIVLDEKIEDVTFSDSEEDDEFDDEEQRNYENALQEQIRKSSQLSHLRNSIDSRRSSVEVSLFRRLSCKFVAGAKKIY